MVQLWQSQKSEDCTVLVPSPMHSEDSAGGPPSPTLHTSLLLAFHLHPGGGCHSLCDTHHGHPWSQQQEQVQLWEADTKALRMTLLLTSPGTLQMVSLGLSSPLYKMEVIIMPVSVDYSLDVVLMCFQVLF